MKVVLTLEEIIRYDSEIIVEQPPSMSDEEFEKIITKAERQCKQDSAKDIALVLGNSFNLKIHEVRTGFPDSPSSSDLEIIDVRNVKE